MKRIAILSSALVLGVSIACGGGSTLAVQAAGGNSGYSQACTATANQVFGVTLSHGACVAANLPVNRESSLSASYCSLYTFPADVYDPVADQIVYDVPSHGACVDYVNQTYKHP
jgi:hypothetical protein